MTKPNQVFPEGHRFAGLNTRIVHCVLNESNLESSRYHALKEFGTSKDILQLAEAISDADLMRIPNFGKKSLQVLSAALGRKPSPKSVIHTLGSICTREIYDWFTLSPQYRTREKLIEMIADAITESKVIP